MARHAALNRCAAAGTGSAAPAGPRRRALRAALAGGLTAWAALHAHPARAQAIDPALRRAIDDWAGAGALAPRPGRVTLEIPPLVENGNAVPVTIRVASPQTDADHVREIALVTARNPQPDVVRCTLTPLSGRAEVALRIRLATTQTVVALVRLSDGSTWQHAVEVVVTLAACVES